MWGEGRRRREETRAEVSQPGEGAAVSERERELTHSEG